MSIPVHRIGIGNINNCLIRAKANAIRSPEAISHNPNVTILRIVSIHLIGEFWFASEFLIIPVTRVSEPESAIPGHDYVIHRVEVSSMEVGNYRVWRGVSRH
jgi:hypothetical protein